MCNRVVVRSGYSTLCWVELLWWCLRKVPGEFLATGAFSLRGEEMLYLYLLVFFELPVHCLIQPRLDPFLTKNLTRNANYCKRRGHVEHQDQARSQWSGRSFMV